VMFEVFPSNTSLISIEEKDVFDTYLQSFTNSLKDCYAEWILMNRRLKEGDLSEYFKSIKRKTKEYSEYKEYIVGLIKKEKLMKKNIYLVIGLDGNNTNLLNAKCKRIKEDLTQLNISSRILYGTEITLVLKTCF
jgi:hypothetical protein